MPLCWCSWPDPSMGYAPLQVQASPSAVSSHCHCQSPAYFSSRLLLWLGVLCFLRKRACSRLGQAAVLGLMTSLVTNVITSIPRAIRAQYMGSGKILHTLK